MDIKGKGHVQSPLLRYKQKGKGRHFLPSSDCDFSEGEEEQEEFPGMADAIAESLTENRHTTRCE